jgi:hypothetical protein
MTGQEARDKLTDAGASTPSEEEIRQRFSIIWGQQYLIKLENFTFLTHDSCS